MPLSDLQIALGALVTSQTAIRGSAADAQQFGRLHLTSAERAWIAQLLDTPGLSVTCYIQRWWRETKLSWTARLTLTALGPAQADAALKSYLDATVCPSLFFTPEALGFLDFVASEAELPHVAEIARFERALLVAKEAAQQSADRQHVSNQLPANARLAPHPAAALLEFAAPPEELLGALVARQALPPMSASRFPVIVAPGLPHLWRPAAADEAQLFTACQTATAVESLCELIPHSAPALTRLLRAGALQPAV